MKIKDHCLYTGWTNAPGDNAFLLVPVGEDIENYFRANCEDYIVNTALHVADVPASALAQWLKQQQKPQDATELEQCKAIYAAYPRHVAPEAAYRAIKKALKEARYTELMALTMMYKNAVTLWPANEKKFIPMPATFFNQKRYHDDQSQWKRGVVANHEEGF